jgi:hypothetical protein
MVKKLDDMFMNEFRPPDESMVEYMLDLSASLMVIANRDNISSDDSEVLKRSAHSMRVLLGMAVGGYFLFTSESKHSDGLADLASKMYDLLLLSGHPEFNDIDVNPLILFRSYREDGPDVSDLPYIGEGDD